MKKKNKLIISLLIISMLFLIEVAAQTANNTYLLTLNYKKQLFIESLSFVGIQEDRGSATDSGTQLGKYKLDIISLDNSVLKTIRFNMPAGSEDDFNFTISVPYFDNIKVIYVYDNNNKKILVIPMDSIAGIKGEIEVIHTDDFEHPENSKFIFYLRTDNERYELKYDKELPVVLSGTIIKLKGKIVDDKILIDNSSIRPFEIISPPEYITHPKLRNYNSTNPAQRNIEKIQQKINLKWMYTVLPVLLLVTLLFYFLFKRRRQLK